jgi:hypothetical protein
MGNVTKSTIGVHTTVFLSKVQKSDSVSEHVLLLETVRKGEE